MRQTKDTPFRYVRPPQRTPSFLEQALLAAPEVAPTLIATIDWHTPVTVMDYVYGEPDNRRGVLKQVHPLSCVALTGRVDWFELAVEAAGQESGKGIYLERQKEFGSLTDWVGSGVVGTVAGQCEPAMLAVLMKGLTLHQGQTRYLFQPNGFMGELVQKANPTFPKHHWSAILDVVESAMAHEFNRSIRHSNAKEQAKAEKAWKDRIYHELLEDAARSGRVHLAEAALDRVSHVSPVAVSHALGSGASDLATLMINSHRFAFVAPYLHDRDDRNTPTQKALGMVGNALNRAFEVWQPPYPPHVSETQAQEQWAHTVAFPQTFLEEVVFKATKDPSREIVAGVVRWLNQLTPSLNALTEEQAKGLMDASLESGVLPMPDLAVWMAWLPPSDQALTPWAQTCLDHLQGLPDARKQRYLEGLGQELNEAPTDVEQTLGFLRALTRVWAGMAPAGLNQGDWIASHTSTLKNFLAKEDTATLNQIILDLSWDSTAPKRPRPRV